MSLVERFQIFKNQPAIIKMEHKEAFNSTENVLMDNFIEENIDNPFVDHNELIDEEKDDVSPVYELESKKRKKEKKSKKSKKEKKSKKDTSSKLPDVLF